MRLPKLLAAAIVGAGLFTLAACSGEKSTKEDEAAIHETNAKWLELINTKNPEAIAALYAEDGMFLAPNAPKVAGRDAIKTSWTGMFQIPGVELVFATEKLIFSQGGDMAVDVGNYTFKAGPEGAQSTDKGKSVVVWVKRDNKWLILSDMFSSDAAPLPATPTPPPAAPETPAAGTVPEGAPTPAAPESSSTPAPATP